jgi:hypothetical protein
VPISLSYTTSGPDHEPRSPKHVLIGFQSVRQWLAFLGLLRYRCPCVEKLRTVLPLSVGIRGGAVQAVSTLGSLEAGGVC